MEFVDLIMKIPKAWQNIFKKSPLSDTKSQEVCPLPIWLKRVKEMPHLDWSSLVDVLSVEEPDLSTGALNFIPRLFLLPTSFRRDLSGLLYLHRKHLLPESLARVAHMLTSSSSQDEWVGMYAVLFQQHVSLKATPPSTESWDTAYHFSEANLTAADEVSQLLRKSSRSSPHPPPAELLGNSSRSSPHPPPTEIQGNSSRSSTHPPPSALQVTKTAQACDTTAAPTSGLPQPVPPKEEETPCERNAPPHKRLRLDVTTNSNVEDCNLSISNCSQSQGVLGLDAELLMTASLLRETWHTACDAQAPVPSEITILTRCTNHQMELICAELDLEHLPEVGIATSCEHMVSIAKDLTCSNAESFARACLLPQIGHLQQNLSRMLFTSLTSFLQAFPQQTITACLVPAVCSKAKSAAVAELISRLLKTVCTPSQGQDFLRVLLSASPVWDENSVSIIQILVDNKMEMSAEMLDSLLSSFAARCAPLSSSLKFAKLMLAILSKYGSEMSDSHASHANLIVMGNKTFLKKPLLAAMKKVF